MSRSAKKFVYGALFTFLFIVVAWGVFRSFVPGPSCSDGTLNQGETGIDCGGPCAPCAVQTEPLRAVGTVQVFGTESGKAVLLAPVMNPNAAFAASPFTYSFVVYGKDGKTLETTPKETWVIHASEQEYLFESDVSALSSAISKAELVLGDAVWRPGSEVPRPELSATWVTSVEPAGVRVRGAVENASSLAARTVKIVALLFDQFSQPLFAAQTVVDRVEGNSTEDFPPILFPPDAFLARAVAPTSTEVFVSGL